VKFPSIYQTLSHLCCHYKRIHPEKENMTALNEMNYHTEKLDMVSASSGVPFTDKDDSKELNSSISMPKAITSNDLEISPDSFLSYKEGLSELLMSMRFTMLQF
jgi:hypothetical protein